jgi:putative PEP-CTERM system TPR-repeat lipoprotein
MGDRPQVGGVLKGTSGSGSSIAFSIDGKTLYVTSAQKGIEAWEVKTADAAPVESTTPRSKIEGHEDGTRALAVLGKDRPEVLNSLGLLFMEMGRYDEALMRFQSATAQDSANPVYWLNTARVQLSLGNAATAREALEKAVAVQPGWLPAVGTLAMLDVKEGRESSALQRVDALKSSRPRDVETRILEGDVYLASKNYAKAAVAYDAAAEIKPSGMIAMRAYRARQAGHLENPARPLEKWLNAHPADNGVRMVLAEAYEASGDRRKAIGQYELIGRGTGTNAIVLNNLAWLYLLEHDGRAEETARQAHALAPRAASVADTYGWILLDRGKAKEAVGILRQAAVGSPDPSIQYHLAAALAQTGEQAEARRLLEALLAKTPAFEAAADARKLLDSLAQK